MDKKKIQLLNNKKTIISFLCFYWLFYSIKNQFINSKINFIKYNIYIYMYNKCINFKNTLANNIF